MPVKIYTKIGDRGETGTQRGRLGKFDHLIVAIGSIDELNSWIGLCRASLKPQISNFKLDDKLKGIQTNLFIIGSILAGSKKYKFTAGETGRLEELIDKLEKELPRINNFVYPIGFLQVARAVARRGEREVVSCQLSDKNILKYMNRLSDALFVIGRWVNFKTEIKEEVWGIDR